MSLLESLQKDMIAAMKAKDKVKLGTIRMLKAAVVNEQIEVGHDLSSDEEIAVLCDIAMCGDHGIGECYKSVLDLPKCIAKGDDICSLRYHKKDK